MSTKPKKQAEPAGQDSKADKPKSDWKQKLVDLIGQRCCWNLNAECCEDCKNVWRLWICLASFYTLIFSAFEFAFIIHLFLPYSDNTSIFIADKLKKLFILNDNMFPVWTLCTTVCTFCLSIWSLVFSIQPNKARTPALVAYKLISSLVVLSCFVLAIVQIVLCIIEWPDDKYKLELERVMRNDMEFGRPPDLIRKNWVDTQDAFQCCGIYSWVDWFAVSPNRSRNSGDSELSEPDSERELPLSCCEVQHDFCTEPKAWKAGCLEEQVYQMKTYSLFNTLFIYILYHLANWLSLSIQKYFKKFPALESPDEENPDGKSPAGSKNGKPDSKASQTRTNASANGKPVNKVQSEAVGVGFGKPPPSPTRKSLSQGAVVNVEDDDSKVILPPRKWSKNDV